MVLIVDSLTCCTDLVVEGYVLYAAGFFIVVVTLQNLLFNLVIIVMAPIRRLRLVFKLCMAVREKRKGRAISFFKQNANRFFGKKLKRKLSFMKDSRLQSGDGQTISSINLLLESRISSKTAEPSKSEKKDEGEFDSHESKTEEDIAEPEK